MEELIPHHDNYKKLLSLQELLEDYEDYLKTRNHRLWEDTSVEHIVMRRLGCEHNDTEFFMNIVRTRPPETIANMCIILIKQADYLLFRQLKRLEEDFLKNGGFNERMYRLRKQKKTFLVICDYKKIYLCS